METKKSMDVSESAEQQDGKGIIVGAPDVSALKKPAPQNQVIQCYIKRDKANSTYHLFLGLDTEKGKFLLSARRINRLTCVEIIISPDAENISQNNTCYMGKLKSNFWENKFTVYSGAVTSQGSSSQGFFSRKVSPSVPCGRCHITLVAKRVKPFVRCTLRSIPSSVLESNDTVPSDSDLSLSLCSGEVPRLVLKSRTPKWDKKLQCWFLNSRERETLPSVKTFQLIYAPEVPAENSNSGSAQAAGSGEPGEIILQFGKIGENLFSMDYRYPLSAFIAFGFALALH
eukprot:TRINITY_DN2941_c1_g2_i1.p1 TRINITY_DN2941_c1_g2~~TRINITY_DN2941_c1_g2_i1.p1  ORF type:complete len:286 (-),score=35.20 TRINITY_DN2941_c1_g2_i1:76-933(-)